MDHILRQTVLDGLLIPSKISLIVCFISHIVSVHTYCKLSSSQSFFVGEGSHTKDSYGFIDRGPEGKEKGLRVTVVNFESEGENKCLEVFLCLYHTKVWAGTPEEGLYRNTQSQPNKKALEWTYLEQVHKYT